MPRIGEVGKKQQDVSPQSKYPQVAVKKRSGETSLTLAEAKDILGWCTRVRTNDRSFKDADGCHILCQANLGNRPLDLQSCRTIAKDILQGKWRFNLENIILSKTGKVSDGQHRLIGFVLACQEWSKNPQKYPHWASEPTLDTLLAVGGEDTDEVINTIGTGRSRSLTDVLSRSYHFQGFPERVRVSLAGLCNYGIKLVWDRTGVEGAYDAPGLRRTTIAESIDFLDRHLRLRECAQQIHDMPKAVGFPPGAASGMLYLMGCSQSDPDSYTQAMCPDESLLSWNSWDAACEFWRAFANREKKLKSLGDALQPQISAENEIVLEYSLRAKASMIAKAWALFMGGEKISRESLEIPCTLLGQKFSPKEEFSVGGIDTVGSVLSKNGNKEGER